MKIDRNCSVLSNSRWEMLLKAIGQPLGTAKKGIGKPLGNAQRLLDSFWAILRGYWKAAGKCPNFRHQPIGDKVEFPSGYWIKQGKSPSLFSEAPCFY